MTGSAPVTAPKISASCSPSSRRRGVAAASRNSCTSASVGAVFGSAMTDSVVQKTSSLQLGEQFEVARIPGELRDTPVRHAVHRELRDIGVSPCRRDTAELPEVCAAGAQVGGDTIVLDDQLDATPA